MSGASVLYDVPGPRAIARNRIFGVVTVVIVAAIVAFIAYQFWASGQFEPAKWNIFTYTLVWEGMAKALWATVSAFLVAGIGSLILGFVLAIGRMSDHAWVRAIFTVIVEIMRAVPVLVMMMLFFYGLPSVTDVKITPFIAVVVALILYNGSVLAEALRAGIEALPRGQSEAGYAVGLRKSGVMMLILLPQAVRNMLPVIIAQLVVTLKDTALGFIITYPELLYYAKQLSSQQGRPLLQAGIVVAVIYIGMCLILSGTAKWIEVRTAKRQRALHADAPDGGVNVALMHEATETQVIGLQNLPHDNRNHH